MTVEAPNVDTPAELSIDAAIAEMQAARETAQRATPPEPDAEHQDALAEPHPSNPDNADSDEGDVFEDEPDGEEPADETDEDFEEEDGESESESQSVTDLHKVRDGDEEIEVTLEELKGGYLRRTDYSKKTAALSEARKKIESLAATVETDRKLYAERAEAYAGLIDRIGSALDADGSKFESVDWEKLRREDAAEYLLKRDEYRLHLEKKQAVQDEAERLRQEQGQEFQKSVAKAREALATTLLSQEYFPHWQDDKRRQTEISAMEKTARDDGFDPQELAQITDPRLYKMLWKAAQYDRIKSRKATGGAQSGGEKEVVRRERGVPAIRTLKANPSRPTPTIGGSRERRAAAALKGNATFSGIDEVYDLLKAR